MAEFAGEMISRFIKNDALWRWGLIAIALGSANETRHNLFTLIHYAEQ